jgi:lipopolysaccharide export system permease protein
MIVGIIDWYIIKKYLGTFMFTMAIFTVIIIVFDISERLDDFIKHDAPISKIIFEYYAGFIPFYLNFLSPLINFIAVIFFTAKMADQTEIVPILSGGMSFNRFLWPYFISSFVIFFVTLIFNLFIIPQTNRLLVDFTNTYIDPKSDNTKMFTHLQLNENSYVYIENFDNNQKTGFKFSLETFKGDSLVQKITADRILWDSVKHNWKLEGYNIRKIDGLKESLKSEVSKVMKLDMEPVDFELYDNLFKAMSMKELNTRIDKEKIRGSGEMDALLLEKYRRFVYPFSAFILTLMGVSLSSKKVRGGIGLPLGVGILLSFIYILFIQFANMFSLKGGLPPLVAVIIPNVLFAILGVYLLFKAPK